MGTSKGNKLDGGVGADTLIGQRGNDFYLTEGYDSIVEQRGQGRDTVLSSGNYTLANHVEILRLVGRGDIDGTGNKTRTPKTNEGV